MAVIYFKNEEDGADGDTRVSYSDPLPVEIRFRSDSDDDNEEVDSGHPLPVKLSDPVRTEMYVTPMVRVNYGATSGALDANDALGDVFVFDVPAKGRILSVKMVDQDDDTLAATIHVFSKDFVAAASDAAFTISAADAVNWIT